MNIAGRFYAVAAGIGLLCAGCASQPDPVDSATTKAAATPQDPSAKPASLSVPWTRGSIVVGGPSTDSG
jgi:PBP1b-binding outer membrane lipoprotein LpoB